ncbi:MAG: LacI family transcriptional regulator [Bifidobacterium mongoliense]|uniref:LacI family DNA-binding transcriptional regulator n=1 Tax=Acidipropionibacterium acidipropionici TaxID=1748 RepID=UPI00055B25B8|nr:LacI family DNA-binding transcriptional regulator [Acidipropionibacterium acidipropionici]ALN14924.1 LacI family transcriptional regulator [Acidipropionibacterium acidipropionici]APZ09326.1 LacI family transcriptional regulator [Acidipropionibacterium acidipropionici]MDN6803215.1 LacI family transcriptional regulator [Bifidobacterium mongoliense]
MQKRATLADVAAAAGVSVATASKALHNRPRVGAATRERVRRAASELAYVPNAQAQSLVTGRSSSIGLITSDPGGMFSAPIMVGAEDELSASSSTVLLSYARGDPELERRKLDFLVSRNVDGILVVNAEPNPRRPIEAPIPVVYAYAASTNSSDSSVVVDNVYAGRLAAERLIRAGRTRIGLIGGESRFEAAQDRLTGSLEALARADLGIVGESHLGDWSASWGRTSVRNLIESGIAFDGVICQSDVLAQGCIFELMSHGIRIPDDVAVIGHDNWDFIADLSTPRLTTIDNNLSEIGARAARRLMDAIDGHPDEGIEAVRGEVVEGETVP